MGRAVTRPVPPEAAMTVRDSYLDPFTARKEATDHAA
jgi:hypothetical protein